MSYRYLPDVAIADVAFEAEGGTLEELFSSSVDAALGVMVESPEAIPLVERRPMAAEDAELDILLFKLLGEVVYYKDADRLLLRCPRPAVRKKGGLWRLSAELEGAGIDSSGELLLDVKAVTLHMLRIERSAGGWTARVVLDI
jgi:SHS2 domain-containing protein